MDKAIKMMGYRNAERFVMELALMRRSFELMGFDVKDYDAKLDEWAEKYFKEFAEMGKADLMAIMTTRMGGGDE